MTRMERKMRRRNAIVNLLIIVGVVLAILLAGDAMFEAQQAYRMLEEAEATNRIAETVLVEARAAMANLETAKPVSITIQAPVAPVEEVGEPVRFWEEIPLTAEMQGVLLDSCEEFNVPFSLALAVMEQESRFQMVEGDGGSAAGYFQVWSKWWGWLMEEIGTSDLNDPAQNARTGCAVLGHLLSEYGTEVDALSAYNTGKPGQTRYAAEVMERQARWEEIVCQK